ncbi:lysine-specific demethylase JMJ25 [Cucumis melo var. makuwa]|uniref:Lysine-specific demethylase JMJ25 n=1 Tax=Cucumis melo var. makuwa TaxID=1194695 RepID=A0A5A7VKZ5_CUCMM|nr:lysine-specific demethylase JMJ25 [Cucumis melo var. makuwa]TYK28933.1 lysine-specific demethylase JMJ25 [Cucumis melo var. makuwa]
MGDQDGRRGWRVGFSTSKDRETLQWNEGENNGKEEKGFVGGENGELKCKVSIQSSPRSLRKKVRVSYNEEVYEFDEDDVVEIPFKKPGRRGRKKKEFSSNRIISKDDSS